MSAVRDCLFNLFAATLLIGGRSSIRNLRTRHAVVTGTHYMERIYVYIYICVCVCVYIYIDIVIYVYVFHNTYVLCVFSKYIFPQ